MELNEYVKNYNFNRFFEENINKFKDRELVKKYLENNSEEAFKQFAEDFWKIPDESIEKLKNKNNISRQISYSDIIKAYPTKEYTELLIMYYKNNSIEELVEKFKIPYNKIEKILAPLKFLEEDQYCPQCFNNQFNITINEKQEGNYELECQGCNNIFDISSLLNEEEVDKEIEKKLEARGKFDKQIEQYEKELNDIKCPICQEKLKIYKYNKSNTYKIRCSKCEYISNDIFKTIELYNDWKKRAAMMIAIKAKEEELIEKALENKKEEDIIFLKEDSIKFQENNNTFDFFRENLELDNIHLWNEFLKQIKECNRLEKNLLYKLVELVDKKENKRYFGEKEKRVDVYAYFSNEENPIVYELMNITKILVIRQVLRKLINNHLVIASEEENYIAIPSIIVKNIDSIKNLLVVKDMNPNIRYLIFQRQNFTCMTCGETGRPLKIAYLTSDKDINNLNNLIALCDNCHEMMTRNDILVDGTISFKIDYLINEKSKSMGYLIQFYPELKDDKAIIQNIDDWEDNYEIDNIIKALTITVDKIKNNKIEATVAALINYTKGILKRAEEEEKDVFIYDTLKEKYKLDKWIEEI